MRGQMDTEMGRIQIDKSVLAKYAGSAAVECIGVVGMASVNMKDGVAKLLNRDNISHGVAVSLEGGKLKIALHIVVAYGVSITVVVHNLIDNVQYKIEEYTGMEVEKIQVFVESVRVVD